MSSTNQQAIVQSAIDHYRSGWYTGMTTLTSEKVQKDGVRLLWECDLPGDYRGSEHQPLIVPNVTQTDGTICSVMIAATMSDDVFCFDYDKPDPTTGRGRVIWQRRIGHPVINQRQNDMFLINQPFWGALSCPYIDVSTQTVYVCYASSPDQTLAKVRYYLRALSLVDGSDKCPPLDISTAVYNSPGGPIRHDASPRKQRSALGFYSYNNGTHDVIFVCDSTFAMMSNVAHGFMVACNVTGVRTGKPMAIDTCWTASAPPYAGCGIWMAGEGPAFNDEGDLFVVVANGAFDPTKGCFGNASVKLRFTPPTATEPASIKPLTWFAAYSDCGRTGKDPTIPWIGLTGNYAGQMDGMSMTAPDDQDLGCAQGAYIPKSITGFTDNLFCPCGKDGISYGLNADAMGDTLIGDFAPGKIQANYEKALWITGGTYFPGDFDITPTDLGQMSTTVDGFTHHQHSKPPFYMSPDHGLLIYYGGENGPVRVFRVTQDAVTHKYACTYLATGNEIASAGVPAPGGMPGVFMTISTVGAEPSNTGLLHCLMPLNGDANKAIVQGRYVIYGPNWVNDPDQLVKIWDSANYPGIRFSHCKFGKPAPALDKIAVPTYDAKIFIFG